MILDATTKSLEVVLAGAVATAQPVWYAAFADHTAVAFTPGASDGLTNGVTAVTAVVAPVSGVQRQIKLFSLFNNDTAAVTATVRVNNNATLRIVVKITLAVGDTLEYDPSNGWKVITAGGTVKSGISPAGATGEIQYNAGGGSLGASPNLAWSIANNQLLLGNGTAANPSHSFVASIGLGFFRPAADVLGLAVAGVERARFITGGSGVQLQADPDAALQATTKQYVDTASNSVTRTTNVTVTTVETVIDTMTVTLPTGVTKMLAGWTGRLDAVTSTHQTLVRLYVGGTVRASTTSTDAAGSAGAHGLTALVTGLAGGATTVEVRAITGLDSSTVVASPADPAHLWGLSSR